MSKKKIAESIIIRVGGGVREVPREPADIAYYQEPANLEPGFEQKEDTQAVMIDGGTNIKFSAKKIIN